MGRLGRILNTTTGLIVSLILVTLIGAILFTQIEGPAEIHTKVEATKARQKIFVLAQELAEEGEDADWSKLVTQVDHYRDKLQQAWKAGKDEMGATVNPPSWNLWGSIYYCITLFTTIGYGNVFPNTTLGRVVTIVYGLISIPLCSLVLSRLSKLIKRCFNAIYTMTLDSSGIPCGLRDAYTRANTAFDYSLITCIGLLVSYASLSGVIYCWGIRATAEQWNPFDAVYYSFISMTTIGLGDIIPNSTVFLNIVSLIYIIIGLAITSTVFNRFVEIMETGLTRISKPNEETASEFTQMKFSHEGVRRTVTTNPSTAVTKLSEKF